MEGDTCKKCDGTGRKDTCDYCDNNGWVDDPSDGGTMTCPECYGDSGKECLDCEGVGTELASWSRHDNSCITSYGDVVGFPPSPMLPQNPKSGE